MYNFITLNLNCPLCGISLMDKENLVDNEPSVELKIQTEKGKGFIHLSSIYGSFNYTCDFLPEKGSLTKFFCPSCKGEIAGEIKCEACNAPMVPLHLDIGGKVAFCSRAGCQNHFVEFEDLSNALRKFYQEYGNHQNIITEADTVEKMPDITSEEKEKDDIKEIIETGSFLYAYCPHCKKSLIETDTMKIKIVNDKDEEGFIFLSPYLNVFSSRSTVFLPEDKVIKDLKCFYCDTSLVLKNKTCEKCDSPVALISIGARTKLIDFYMCSKKGCRWHGLSEDDIHDIKLEDSIEW